MWLCKLSTYPTSLWASIYVADLLFLEVCSSFANELRNCWHILFILLPYFKILQMYYYFCINKPSYPIFTDFGYICKFLHRQNLRFMFLSSKNNLKTHNYCKGKNIKVDMRYILRILHNVCNKKNPFEKRTGLVSCKTNLEINSFTWRLFQLAVLGKSFYHQGQG